MTEGKSPKCSRLLLPLALLAASIAVSICMTIQAHKYYYPNNTFGQRVTATRTTFMAERSGRYEIDYDGELGDLTFDVVETETGSAVPVEEFSLLTRAFHTAGRRGYAIQIERPGSYQLSTQPWLDGAELILGFCDTRAIARWSLAGIVLGGAPAALAFLLFIAMLRTKLKSPGP